MMRLEDTWFVAAFHSTPMHDPGPERGVPISSSGLRVRAVLARVDGDCKDSHRVKKKGTIVFSRRHQRFVVAQTQQSEFEHGTAEQGQSPSEVTFPLC